MLQKKICMLGASGVGKTRLVQRFVQSIYSEKYHSTIGVKIDKKIVEADGQAVTMMLWDVQGEDDEHKIRTAYLRGASGYLLVVDGTRPETLEVARTIQQRFAVDQVKIPFVLAVNKIDLIDAQVVTEKDLSFINGENAFLLKTSAKTGQGVNEAFQKLAEKMLAQK